MLFLKRPFRTRLDLLRPDYGVNAYSGQASQKEYQDSCSKDRHFSIGQKVMTRNFLQGMPWVRGVIKECCGSLTYMVEVGSGVLWKRHVDHIKDRHELELIGEEREMEHQRMSEDAVDQQISMDTKKLFVRRWLNPLLLTVVRVKTCNRTTLKFHCNRKYMYIVHGRTEVNPPTEAEARSTLPY